jgi:hypothetical protein
MAAKVKPVRPTEIKDKKIAIQVIEEIRKPIPASLYRRHENKRKDDPYLSGPLKITAN